MRSSVTEKGKGWAEHCNRYGSTGYWWNYKESYAVVPGDLFVFPPNYIVRKYVNLAHPVQIQ